MRGLLRCCREELLCALGGAVSLGWLLLLVPICWNGAASWNGSGVPLLLSLHLLTVVGAAVASGLCWPFSGPFALERTSGRPAWQSVGGRLLFWAGLIGAGAVLQQIFLHISLAEFGDVWPRIWSDGAERVARLERWASWEGALTALALGMGAYVSALSIALWCRNSRSPRRHSLGGAAVLTLLFGYLLLFLARGVPLWLLGTAVTILGAAASCWLLEHRSE